VFQTEIFRSSTFRLAAVFSTAFTIVTVVLFAFIYWETAIYETQRIDAFMVDEVNTLVGGPETDVLRAVGIRVVSDLHRITFAALFTPDGALISGNLQSLPPGLPADGRAHATDAILRDGPQVFVEAARAVARPLRDGRILIIGRNVDELLQLRRVVLRALGLGLIPAILLSFATSAVLSLKTLNRVKIIHQAIGRIMRGHLDERLPARGSDDDLDQLVHAVNQMLDEIASLVEQVRGVGDDIAHDLRTPLTRLRTRLDRSRLHGSSPGEMQIVIDRTIVDLDQTLGIITALLRLGEIENTRRRLGFTTVSLDALIQEIGDLYHPIAEAKNIVLDVAGAPGCCIAGDRDLLTEAIANLVDNAIKFTPDHGAIHLRAFVDKDGRPVVQVADSGPGIALDERAAVLKRFYRSDKSRHVEGSGLGLSLVAAIARLHGLSLVISDDGPGCVVTLSSQSTDGGDSKREFSANYQK
jgi:signal transduction histidine kinase